MRKQVFLSVLGLICCLVFSAYASECELTGEHVLELSVVPNTCTESGSVIRFCTRPGCNYTETEVIPPEGHSFDNGICVRCGLSELTPSPIPEDTEAPSPVPTVSPTYSPLPAETVTPSVTDVPSFTPDASATPGPSPAVSPSRSEGPVPVTEVPFIPTGNPSTPVPEDDPSPSSAPVLTELPAIPADNTNVPPTNLVTYSPSPAVTPVPVPVTEVPAVDPDPTPVPVLPSPVLPEETVIPGSGQSDPGTTPDSDNTGRAEPESTPSAADPEEPSYALELSLSIPGDEGQLILVVEKAETVVSASGPDIEFSASFWYIRNLQAPELILHGKCRFDSAVHRQTVNEDLLTVSILRVDEPTLLINSETLSLAFIPDGSDFPARFAEWFGLDLSSLFSSGQVVSGTYFAE